MPKKTAQKQTPTKRAAKGRRSQPPVSAMTPQSLVTNWLREVGKQNSQRDFVIASTLAGLPHPYERFTLRCLTAANSMVFAAVRSLSESRWPAQDRRLSPIMQRTNALRRFAEHLRILADEIGETADELVRYDRTEPNRKKRSCQTD